MARKGPTRTNWIDEIAGAIGWERMLIVAEKLGGQRVHIPKKCGPNHLLVRCCGQEIADLMSNFFADTEINIPVKLRREALVRALASRRPKLSTNQIAEATGLTYRGVAKILARVPTSGIERVTPSRQLTLFENC